jgi:hypothetical protein
LDELATVSQYSSQVVAARRVAVTQAEEALPSAQRKLSQDASFLDQMERDAEVANQYNRGLIIHLQALFTISSQDGISSVLELIVFAVFVILECLPIMLGALHKLEPRNTYEQALEITELRQLRSIGQ